MPAHKQTSRQMARRFSVSRFSKQLEGGALDIKTIGQLKLTLALVSNIYQIEAAYLLGKSRGRARLSKARHVLHYMAHIGFGVNYKTLSEFASRDRTSVAHGCQRIEDMRDDPNLDKALFFAELALRTMAQHTGNIPENENSENAETQDAKQLCDKKGERQ